MPAYSTRRNALKILDQCGLLYKTDFYLLLKSTSRTYSLLLEKELIEETKIPTQSKKKDKEQLEDIVKITRKGQNDYIENLKDPYFDNMSKYSEYTKTQSLANKYFETNSRNVIERNGWAFLSDAKVKVLFSLAGVKTFPYEKPSLKFLWYNLSKNKNKSRLLIDEMYLDQNLINNTSTLNQELNRYLEEGLYYSKKEVSDFLDYVSPNSNDSFKSIIFRGIFLSKKTCLVTFLSSYGENKRISNHSEPLNSLLDKLYGALCNPNDPITEVKRPLPFISQTTDPSRYDQHGINVLVFSIGDSLVYSMATGYKNGVKTKADIVELKNSLRAKNTKLEHDLLDVTSTKFDRIFVVQDNVVGIKKLTYLTTYSLEDWYREMLDLFKEDSRFSVSKDKAAVLTPGINNKDNSPAIYIPVHEIKLYGQLFLNRNKYNKITIVASNDMLDAISHSTRLGINMNLYNTNTKEVDLDDDYVIDKTYIDDVASLDSYLIYNEDGRVTGVEMLNEYLKSNGKSIKNARISNNIAKDMGYKSEELFYNKIALGDLTLSKLFNYNEIKQEHLCKEGENTKDKKRITVRFDLTEDEYSKYLEVMNNKNINSKAILAKSILMPIIDEEYNKIK